MTTPATPKNPKTAPAGEQNVRSRAVLADDEVLEALKECEYALQQVLRIEKVGWLQQEAHKTACAVLENVKTQKRKSANEKIQP
jgi:hypothetical protein